MREGSIYGYIDQRDAGSEVRVRIYFIHEGMLTPVPHHQAQTHEHERDPEREHRGPGIDAEGHVVQKRITRRFRQESFDSKIRLSLTEKVHRQIPPDKKEEPAKILRKTPRRIALIPNRRREITRPIALDMMVLDVVVVVRVPGMTHQRLQDVGERDVEPVPVFGQDAIIVDVIVHEQGEGAGAPEAIDCVQDAVEVSEVVEEVEGAGEVDAEVEEDMREEDYVSRVARYGCGEAGVGFDDC